MLVEGCNLSIKTPQKCAICKIIRDQSEFNLLKRNKDQEVGLATSCKKCNLEKAKHIKTNLELKY